VTTDVVSGCQRYDDDNSKRSIISTCLVTKMKSVTSLTLDMKDMKSRSHVSMLMLVDMPNLDTVKIILDDDANHDSFNDLKPIEKLRVKSLDCHQLFLTEFCDPGHLEVLELFMYSKPVPNFGEISHVLGKFRNLRELKITVPPPPTPWQGDVGLSRLCLQCSQC